MHSHEATMRMYRTCAHGWNILAVLPITELLAQDAFSYRTGRQGIRMISPR